MSKRNRYIGQEVDVSDYGVGQRQIWIDDISCNGTERHLNECSHAGWGVHNCQHYEDVAISCISNSSATSFTTGIICKLRVTLYT